MARRALPWFLVTLLLAACATPQALERRSTPVFTSTHVRPDPLLIEERADNVLARAAGWTPPSLAASAESPDPVPSYAAYEEALVRLGYLKEGADDLARRYAVLHFQADANLKVDGTWGDASADALTLREKRGQLVYTDQVAAPASPDLWITINKTQRILTLYQGATPLHKYPIAPGATPQLTPEGQFTFVVKAVNPQWKNVPGGIPQNPLGYRWLGLSIGGGSIYGVHGTNAPWSIGTDASHGCVRMINADVESLYPQVPLGTPVWIGTADELKTWGVVQVPAEITTDKLVQDDRAY